MAVKKRSMMQNRLSRPPYSGLAHALTGIPGMITKLLVQTLLKAGGVLAFLCAMHAPLVLAADPAKTAPPPQAQALPDGVWLVKKGDTLDRIVSRRLASLPFRPDVLRRALVDKNPGAFKNPKSAILTVGAILQLPTLEDFRYLLPAPVPEMLQASAPPPVEAQAEFEPDPRKGWVRFP